MTFTMTMTTMTITITMTMTMTMTMTKSGCQGTLHCFFSCHRCWTRVDDLVWGLCLFEKTRHSKTYIFWHNSRSTETFGVSYTTGGGVPDGGSLSYTVKKGEPLVKMFRKAGGKHYCASCFRKKHHKLSNSVFATIYGHYGHVINVKDMKLVRATIGKFG